jgi:hypothetical protein
VNLVVLRKSRRRPQVGDVFALQPARNAYLFGRVICIDANAGGFPNANLVYIYRVRGTSKTDVPALRAQELLVPPVMTNNLPWVRGYFEFVRHEDLTQQQRLPRHCFRDDRGWLYDEHGRRVRHALGPVGDWALHSYRTIDDLVSAALGIPLSAG